MSLRPMMSLILKDETLDILLLRSMELKFGI